jgi:hypothetical protein
MKTNTKIMSMGIILLISGIIAALLSFEPSRVLQYVFVLTSLAVGVFGVLIARDTKDTPVRSAYYTWIGFLLLGLAIAIVLWATTLTAFMNVVGFFLLAFALIEFGFALRILNEELPIPWKVVGLKLALSAMTAIGGTWILMMAGFNVYTALLFFGVLFALVGLSFIQLSRFAKRIE